MSHGVADLTEFQKHQAMQELRSKLLEGLSAPCRPAEDVFAELEQKLYHRNSIFAAEAERLRGTRFYSLEEVRSMLHKKYLQHQTSDTL